MTRINNINLTRTPKTVGFARADYQPTIIPIYQYTNIPMQYLLTRTLSYPTGRVWPRRPVERERELRLY